MCLCVYMSVCCLSRLRSREREVVVYYDNADILCVCVYMCVTSRLRSRERDVVATRFLHRRQELRLASCTNRFSDRYDAPLERKRLGKFFPGYALTDVYPRKNLGLRWARSILPTKFLKVRSALRDTPFTCQNLPVKT